MTSKLKYRIAGAARVLTRDARQAWATIVVLLALFFAPGLLTCSAEKGFRYAGVGLQLAGLAMVAWGIHETRRRFGRPSLAESLRGWFAKLKNALLLPPKTGSGHPVTVLPGTAETTLTGFAPTVSTTMEGRLAALETKVRDVQQRFFHHEYTEGGPDWHRASVTAYDVPRIDPAWLEAERDRIGDWWYMQEYGCEFVETDDQVFGYELVTRAISSDVTPLFPAGRAAA